MAQFLNPFAGVPFLDSNGDPYVGAQLFVYDAGTSTKVTAGVATKDLAGASNHTNPIILNNDGVIADGSGTAQALWQTGGNTLKLVLAPAGDTDPPASPIRTYDNIAGVNDSTTTIDQWVEGPTPTFVDTTNFTVTGDQTADFHVGRRLKLSVTAGTVYGTITVTAYTTLTTVTVVLDSGSLDSGLDTVWWGLLTATNHSLPNVLDPLEADPQLLENISISASVASSALTIALKQKNGSDPTSGTPVNVAFRSETLTDGDYDLVSATAATSLIIPQGATLGYSANEVATIYVYLLNNSGAIELVAVSEKQIDSSEIYTTTAVSTSSDSKGSLYSTTSRSNVPLRYIGRLKITMGATAGDWDNSPTQIDTGNVHNQGGTVTNTGIRQTVMTGSVDSNGAADFISAGTGLACDLAATTDNVGVSFSRGFRADGPSDSYQHIISDSASAWSGLTANSTSYLYIQDDGASVSYGEVTNIIPTYGPDYYIADGAVKSYLTFDGSDTSTIFTDSNPNNTWTNVGNAQLDTAQFQYGTASGLFDGTGDRITSDALCYAGEQEGGCTFIGWFRISSTGKNQTIVSSDVDWAFEISVNVSNNIYIGLGDNGVTHNIANGVAGTTTLTTGKWYRYRFIWDGSTYKLYLSDSGAAETEEISVASSSAFLGSGNLKYGDTSSNVRPWFGWIDDAVFATGPQTAGTETPPAYAHSGYVDGEHWFDTSTMTMKEWDASTTTWAERVRLFVGEAVTDGSSVTSVVTYALNGMYTSPPFATAADTLYSKNHNIGSTPKRVHSYIREHGGNYWAVNTFSWTRADRLVAKTGFDTNVGTGGAALEANIQQEVFDAAATAGLCYIECDRGW